MLMEVEQIRILFEQEKMTVEQIADDRDLTTDAVKTALMGCSPVYRRLCATEPDDESVYNFSKEQHKRILDVIYETALGAENENVRLKAAIYIRDDAKGRLDIVKNVGGFQFNILQIDSRMKKAMNALNQGLTMKIISNE